MNVDMKTKVLINFGVWKMKCVDLSPKKLPKVYTVPIHVKSTLSYIQMSPQPCRQVTKLQNMNVDMKTKVLIYFGVWKMKCVD